MADVTAGIDIPIRSAGAVAGAKVIRAQFGQIADAAKRAEQSVLRFQRALSGFPQGAGAVRNLAQALQFADRQSRTLGTSFATAANRINADARKAQAAIAGIDGRINAVRRELLGLAASSNAAQASVSRVGTNGARSINVFQRGIKGSIAGVGLLRRNLVSLAAVGGFAGAGFGLAATVRTLAEFGSEVSRIKGVLQDNISSEIGEGADNARLLQLQLGAVEQTARRIGATSGFSSTEAAQGIRILAQAGLDAAESIQTIEPALNLARGGAVSLENAVDALNTIIQGFGLETVEATRVADVLVTVANKTSSGILDLTEAFSTSIPIARAAGLELEEAAAIIGVLSNQQIKGSEAGTSLRAVLENLSNVTPQASRELDKASLSVSDLDIRLNGLLPVLQKVANADFSLGQSLRIFDVRGGVGVELLIEQQRKLRELIPALLEAEGASKRFSDILADNLQGDLNKLRAALQGAILDAGDAGLTGAFRRAAQGATDLFLALSGRLDLLDPANQSIAQFAFRIEDLAGQFKSLLDIAQVTVDLLRSLENKSLFTLKEVELPIAQANLLRAQQAPKQDPGLFSAGSDELIQKRQDEVDRIERAINRREQTILARSFRRTRENTQDRITEAKSVFDEVGSFGNVDSKFQGLAALQVKLNDLIDLSAQLNRSIESPSINADQKKLLGEDLEKTQGLAKDISSEITRIQAARKKAGQEEIRTTEAKRVDVEIQKALDDRAFEISQLKLGAGVEADIQREANQLIRRIESQSDQDITKVRFSDEQKTRLIELIREETKVNEELSESNDRLARKERLRTDAIEAAISPQQRFNRDLALLIEAFPGAEMGTDAFRVALEKLNVTLKEEVAQEAVDTLKGFSKGVALAIRDIGTASDSLERIGESFASSFEDALVRPFEAGESAADRFKSFVAGILQDINREVVRQGIVKPIVGALTGKNEVGSTGNSSADSILGSIGSGASNLLGKIIDPSSIFSSSPQDTAQGTGTSPQAVVTAGDQLVAETSNRGAMMVGTEVLTAGNQNVNAVLGATEATNAGTSILAIGQNSQTFAITSAVTSGSAQIVAAISSLSAALSANGGGGTATTSGGGEEGEDGTGLGATIGSTVGGAVGSIFGPIGTIVGGFIGGALGGLADGGGSKGALAGGVRGGVNNIGGAFAGGGGFGSAGATAPTIIGAAGSNGGFSSTLPRASGSGITLPMARGGLSDQITGPAGPTGGFLAELHDNEGVIPLTNTGRVPLAFTSRGLVASLPGGRSIPVENVGGDLPSLPRFRDGGVSSGTASRAGDLGFSDAPRRISGDGRERVGPMIVNISTPDARSFGRTSKQELRRALKAAESQRNRGL